MEPKLKFGPTRMRPREKPFVVSTPNECCSSNVPPRVVLVASVVFEPQLATGWPIRTLYVSDEEAFCSDLGSIDFKRSKAKRC